ncbi:DUF6049 family protein [Nocardia mangyaensis]|uniref:DUF6049 family protein n=1 Tax=Nocardia mangyaensis TaxID=2213200 RepID=UPI0026745623|nr:DUF6049 family protein [Nocardia mangyaensis]MDO3647438.1 DUF6049 family protein [Nocardia mangyaensis]
MTGGLFRLITAVLTILGSVSLLPAVAHAQPNGSGITTPKFLKLTMDAVAPGTITTDSDPMLTVSGTVTNIGDRVVDDVSVRIQRAAAVTTPSGLRSSLLLDQVNYEVTGPFQDVAERLSPGQRKQFSVSIALRDGTGTASLGLTDPGVYPLLLNVNGEPAYGTQARLDDARFLLPVLGLPPTGGDAAGAAALPVAAPPEATPVATTLVWPLADRPRMVAGKPGSVNGQPELLDDELAVSLGKGGRLEQLVAALESVVPVPGQDQGVAGSVCIAIDPDLVSTVQTMTSGYRVLASPSDPSGATREGTGAANAQAWLDRLRALASSMCTVALPFAQVDLSAVAAVNDPGLSARALLAPADVVDAILGTRSLRGVSLPDSGSIDEPAGHLLRRHGYETAVLAGSAVSIDGAPADFDTALSSAPAMLEPGVVVGGEQAAPDVVRVPAVSVEPQSSTPPVDPALHVTTFDIWSATALAAVGSNPPTPSFTPSKVRFDVTNDSRPARLQDALGAMSWTALNPGPDRPRSQLLMPPQQWGANREEGIALLEQIELLTRHNLAAPRAFADLIAQPPDPRPFALEYLPRAAQDAAPPQYVAPIQAQGARVNELLRALVEIPESELTPLAFLTPAREDLLRALSLSDRRAEDNTLADLHAQRRIDQVTDELDTMFASVSVLPPGGVYTLASEQSPLLLVARNELPVAIRVTFRIEAPAETKITDIGEQLLPPSGTRSFQIPTEVSDSRKLVIPIALTTPEGIALGEATSVSVRSNAYGQALAIITACAAILLLLLAGRRLWRRFRGQPDPADEGFDPETQRRASRLRRARQRLQRQ